MMNNKTKVECYRIICNYLKICSASLLYGFAEFTKFITRLVCSALSAHIYIHDFPYPSHERNILAISKIVFNILKRMLV